MLPIHIYHFMNAYIAYSIRCIYYSTIRRMNFNELQAFAAVSEQGSVSEAAATLFITQPAVTRRIQALENSLGVSLFDRQGKRLRLTEAGEVLLPRAKTLLAARDDATRAIDDLERTVAGRLRLATSHHIGLHRLAPVLKAFTRAYPDVSLDIRFEDSEAAHDLVQSRTCDLAVVTLDPSASTASSGQFSYELIWQDPLAFVAAPDHPLAGSTAVSLESIAGHPAVLPGLATYTGRIVADLFAARGLTLKQSMSTNYLETISMLVAAGLGWSVLPVTMLSDDLVQVAADTEILYRKLGAVRLPERTPSRATSAFLETLRAFASPLRP